MSKKFVKFSVISLVCAGALPVFAAKPVDLNHQTINYLKSITSASKTMTSAPTHTGTTSIEEVSQSTDFNQTVHIRVKQKYAGFPVWGGDAVIHTPQGKSKSLRTLMASTEATTSTMNGVMYEDLQKDLQNTPAYVFNAAQADKAFTQAIADFDSQSGKRAEIINQKKQLMVFVDDNNKAHWAFYVSAKVNTNGKLAKPTYIMDAIDFHVYESWNDLKTLNEEKGGGFGGNDRMGKLTFDGQPGNLAVLDIMRNPESKICYLQNTLATVTDGHTKKTAQFSCEKPDNQHGGLYWNAGNDSVNGGYSPNNDALFAAVTISSLYQSWYQIPVLTKNTKPMVLAMMTHTKVDGESENAAWDDDTETMYFGDGGSTFYPLTSLGVAAHEISHGFTSQHSNLIYNNESGGMNEAFSDMADQAANYFASGKNNFKIGSEIAKQDGFALRYMDKPSQDGMSADTYSNYVAYKKKYGRAMNVHYSSGIYNRAFYLLATSESWDVKKAFDVMVKANRHYWVQSSTFQQGACGVLKAAVDYKYDTAAVTKAFAKVDVDTSTC